MNEREGPAMTAWHEAAHAVVLHESGVGVEKVEVTSTNGGMTTPEAKSLSGIRDEQIALVALAGMHAESAVRTDYVMETGLAILFGATADRNLVFDLGSQWWAQQPTFSKQITHNKAQKMVLDHVDKIEKVAKALLAKSGFPKVLASDEFRTAMSS